MAKKEQSLTVQRAMADFRRAYRSKRNLIEKQREDFLFRLGKQWSDNDRKDMEARKIKPVVDNRIQPNIFLMTGLERQNRTDIKAFPEGAEDSALSDIASALLKDSMKKSDFNYKKSEVFEDGITCGESYLELYLDDTYNVLNGKPVWKKCDFDQIFPDPNAREYDFSDGKFVYKVTKDISEDDLLTLYPEKEREITELEGGKLDAETLLSEADGKNTQSRDYTKKDSQGGKEADEDGKCYDLIERYYKKYIVTNFVADQKTGEIIQADSEEAANQVVTSYQADIQAEQEQFAVESAQYQMAALTDPMATPPAPVEQKDPSRYKTFTRRVPEIWVFAFVPGMEEPLADERAWFYPKWKMWPIIPYFSHNSTAPISGEDAHLKIQGIVRGVKDVQDKHNKAETLKVMHLHSSTSSGWLAEEDAWVDPDMVKNFGTMPGVNLEYKKDRPKPERIVPTPLSQAHSQIAVESAEAIKAILGINADLLAQQGSESQSGKAIALRQKQGLVMVQKPFDNLSRTTQLCGRFLLSQLGEMYDTETSKKVLGEDFLAKTFPPLPQLVRDEVTGEMKEEPAVDASGMPIKYDKELADAAIKTVLESDLWSYDVSVGESVASDTMKMANALELKDIAAQMPGIIDPKLMIEESQLNEATKNRILSALKNAQAGGMGGGQPPMLPPAA